jgi:hypothetical protein
MVTTSARFLTAVGAFVKVESRDSTSAASKTLFWLMGYASISFRIYMAGLDSPDLNP